MLLMRITVFNCLKTNLSLPGVLIKCEFFFWCVCFLSRLQSIYLWAKFRGLDQNRSRSLNFA